MNQKEWILNKRHPCIDCGNLCYYRSIRCRSCYHKYLSIHKGEESKKWRGGETHDDGYILCYQGSGKFIRKHRFVMEQLLGRKLDKDEIVHHINGIRADNRPENLAILDRHQHDTKTLQHIWQGRIQDLEAELGRLRNQYTIPH